MGDRVKFQRLLVTVGQQAQLGRKLNLHKTHKSLCCVKKRGRYCQNLSTMSKMRDNEIHWKLGRQDKGHPGVRQLTDKRQDSHRA